MKKMYALPVVILLCCCSQEKANRKISYAMDLAAPPAIRSSPDSYEAEALPANDSPVDVSRKLIRNGNIHFTTKDVKSTKVEMDKICKDLNAYISTETQNDVHNRLSYLQKIQVPAARFDELLQKTEQLAKHIDSRNIEIEDVTEEFIDTEARLKTKKELEKRYLDLLNKGKTVEELLSIEKELGEIRGDIESMEGRLHYLKNQVAYSTLNVTYYEEETVMKISFASRIGTSIHNGWNNLISFLLALLEKWPQLIVLTGALIVLKRLWKKWPFRRLHTTL